MKTFQNTKDIKRRLKFVFALAGFSLAGVLNAQNHSKTAAPEFSGVGIALEINEGYPEAIKIVPGSPAALSGEIEIGDRIIAIQDGDRKISLQGLHIDDAVAAIRGPGGTDLILFVERDAAPFKVALKRATIGGDPSKPASTENKYAQQDTATVKPIELKHALNEIKIRREADVTIIINAEIKKLNASYLKAIKSKIPAAIKSGDLDSITDYQAEQERVAKGLPIDPDKPLSTSGPLLLQKTYRLQLSKIFAKQASLLATLEAELAETLLNLQTKLVQQRRIEDAVSVRDFREKGIKVFLAADTNKVKEESPAEEFPVYWKWASGGTLQLHPNGKAIHSSWKKGPGEWKRVAAKKIHITNPYNESFDVEFQPDGIGKVTANNGGTTSIAPLRGKPSEVVTQFPLAIPQKPRDLPTEPCRIVIININGEAIKLPTFDFLAQDTGDDYVALGKKMFNGRIHAIKSDGTVVTWDSKKRKNNYPGPVSEIVTHFALPDISLSPKGKLTIHHNWEFKEEAEALENIVSIDASHGFFAALDSSGKLYGMGRDSDTPCFNHLLKKKTPIADFNLIGYKAATTLESNGTFRIYHYDKTSAAAGKFIRLENIGAKKDSGAFVTGNFWYDSQSRKAIGLSKIWNPERMVCDAGFTFVKTQNDWTIWLKEKGSWKNRKDLESALKHSVEFHPIYYKKKLWLVALYPGEIIPRSGYWTIEDLIKIRR